MVSSDAYAGAGYGAPFTWKQAQLKAENYKYSGLLPARIEQAIADDVEFLRAHPTRRSSKPDQDLL